MAFQRFTSDIDIEGYWVTDTSREVKQKIDVQECGGTNVPWVEIMGWQFAHMSLQFKMQVKTRSEDLDVSVFP